MLAGDVIFLKAVGEGWRGPERRRRWEGAPRSRAGGAGWKASLTRRGARARFALPVSDGEKSKKKPFTCRKPEWRSVSVRRLTRESFGPRCFARLTRKKLKEREAGAVCLGRVGAPWLWGGHGMAWHGMAGGWSSSTPVCPWHQQLAPSHLDT